MIFKVIKDYYNRAHTAFIPVDTELEIKTGEEYVKYTIENEESNSEKNFRSSERYDFYLYKDFVLADVASKEPHFEILVNDTASVEITALKKEIEKLKNELKSVKQYTWEDVTPLYDEYLKLNRFIQSELRKAKSLQHYVERGLPEYLLW